MGAGDEGWVGGGGGEQNKIICRIASPENRVSHLKI